MTISSALRIRNPQLQWMADVSVPRARNICLDCHTSFTLRYFDAVKARCERTHRSVANIREYSHDSRIFARFAQCRVKIDAFRAPPMEWWLPHHAHICRQGLQCFGATHRPSCVTSTPHRRLGNVSQFAHVGDFVQIANCVCAECMMRRSENGLSAGLDSTSLSPGHP